MVGVEVLGKGDFFGEMALLESEPRSATVRSVGSTKVLVIQSGGFLLKIRRDPTFAFEMLQRLSGRLRGVTAQLAAACSENGLSTDQMQSLLVASEFGSSSEQEDED